MSSEKLKSMHTGAIGAWLIKASMFKESYCIVMFNQENHETYVNFFRDHRDAQSFVERVALN